ncbi:hypothetical protein Egran_04664 [Elaphomyces granulatus]|uniref:Reverse transcriptase Ty1/copia-type domain-containing protein n=1 Tax=Elaphomyces granulatus TaxID=519963 RepID=A0A232LTS9_9EURO|nr:hypothetical protein Egran_04664 [Elaphomyces granulatus]
MGTKRSKHIDLRYHYTRETAALGIITIDGVSSLEIAADGFTKILNSDGFNRFLRYHFSFGESSLYNLFVL